MKQERSYPAANLTGIMSIILALALLGCDNKINNTKVENSDAIIDSMKVNASNSKTEFAEINGRKIAYRSIGKGESMILCLRFRGDMDSWDPAFLDALAKNYNVIIFDYSGFGLSTGNPPTTMMGFANDVKDLAKALSIQKFIIGGWSFGGGVAQIVTTEMPDLVSGTILIGTRPPGIFKHAPEQIFLETSAKPVNDLNDEVILFFEPRSDLGRKAAKLSHDRIAKRTIDKDVPIKPELWQFYRKGFEDYAADPYKAREKLSATKIPILVISADHEVVFPPENWFELNRKLPTTQIVVIPQTGHGPHHQYPEMVAGYIHSFIKNNKKSATPDLKSN